MKRVHLRLSGLVLVALLCLSGTLATQDQAGVLPGNWSGTMQSVVAGSPLVALTANINRDSSGAITSTFHMTNGCLIDMSLSVAVSGTQITFAGSDEKGDSLTFRGTLSSSNRLSLTYSLNGSASARCEADQGTAILTKL